MLHPSDLLLFFSHIRKFIVTGTVGQEQAFPQTPPIQLLFMIPCLVNCAATHLQLIVSTSEACNPSKNTLNVISIVMFAVSRYFAIFVPSFAPTVRRTTTFTTGVGKAHPDHSLLSPKCRSLSMERWVPSPARVPTRNPRIPKSYIPC